MTFIISPSGVSNTDGTTVKFGSGGSVAIGGNFNNSGTVEIDVMANLNIAGNVINSGLFGIKDYSNLEWINLIKDISTQMEGEPLKLITEVEDSIKESNEIEVGHGLSRFISYLKEHPDLIVGSVQTLLQIIAMRQ